MAEAQPLKRTRSNEQQLLKRTKSDLNSLPKAPSSSGLVFVFGTGDTGQLGLSEDMLERKRPMPLKVLDDEAVVDVICGGMHSIAITESGKVLY
jgi:regulator of chromosome condensation